MPWKSGKCILRAVVGVLVGLNVSLIPVGAKAFADASAESHSQVIELERPAGAEVFPYAINNSDVVAGAVAGNVWRAATWDRNGRIRLLDEVPGGSSSLAILINDRGVSAGLVGAFAARWDNEGRVTMLENPGAKWHQILGINNRDEVVGYVGMPDDTNQAVRWDSSGRVAHLEMLPGTIAGMAHDINDDGVAVGDVITDHGGHAVRWDRTGAITELPSVGYGNNGAWAINRHGMIAGTVQENFPSTPILPGRWDRRGRLTELSVPAGAVTSSASNISDNGSVAGEVGFATRTRATRWDPAGNYVDLQTLPGHMNSWVIAMNDRDVIIGQSVGDTSSSGVFWDQRGRVHTLAPLPGDTMAGPMAINNKGSIAGGSWRPNLSRAVVWRHIA